MTEKYYPKFIIGGQELAFDGRQLYVKYDKYYPVRSSNVELHSKTAYLVNRMVDWLSPVMLICMIGYCSPLKLGTHS
jgi:hypothetical protein